MYRRMYGQATKLNFGLTDYGITDLEPAASFAANDVKIIKDEGAANNSANLPVNEGNGLYSLLLTSTEMQCARMYIVVKDVSTPKVWEDEVLFLETYGAPAAQHPSPPLSFAADEFGELEVTGGGVVPVKWTAGNVRRRVWRFPWVDPTASPLPAPPTIQLFTTKLPAHAMVIPRLWWDTRTAPNDPSKKVQWRIIIEPINAFDDLGTDLSPITLTTGGLALNYNRNIIQAVDLASSSGIEIPDHTLLSIRVLRVTSATNNTSQAEAGFFALDFRPGG